MKRLLVFFILAPLALTAQDNPNYDPDFNGDGCYSIADVLGLLPLFGECAQFQCGDTVFFDNYWYETVLIGDQCWFAENLRTTVYANGDSIATGLADDEWKYATFGATTVYGEVGVCNSLSPNIDACDEEQSLAEYGRMYNWFAVDDARGSCPTGWHVSTSGEWAELDSLLACQGSTTAAALKSTSGWAPFTPVGEVDSIEGNGTNELGFSALPGGWFNPIDTSNISTLGCVGAGGIGMYWNSNITQASWGSYTSVSVISQNLATPFGWSPNFFVSVRCIRDAE